MSTIKKRRTTKGQFTTYIQFLEREPLLRTGKLSPSDDPKSLDFIWKDLATQLNCSGDGPIRTVVEWKKVFTEWKSITRKKARENKELTEQEKQFLKISGRAAVQGLNNIAEMGTFPIGDDEFALVENAVEDEEDKENNYLNCNTNEENIMIEVVAEDAPIKEKAKQKKQQRKTTGDILTDAYAAASIHNKDGLIKIADALLQIAAGINRYCDLVENK